MTVEQRYNIDVTFTDEDPAAVIELMEDAGAEGVHEVIQRGAFGIETLIAGAIAAQALVVLAIKLVNAWKCGVVVDARGPTVHCKKDCDLPRGTVIVLSADGERVQIDRPTAPDLTSLFRRIWGDDE